MAFDWFSEKLVIPAYPKTASSSEIKKQFKVSMLFSTEPEIADWHYQ